MQGLGWKFVVEVRLRLTVETRYRSWEKLTPFAVVLASSRAVALRLTLVARVRGEYKLIVKDELN